MFKPFPKRLVGSAFVATVLSTVGAQHSAFGKINSNIYTNRLNTSFDEPFAEKKNDSSLSGDVSLRSNQLAEDVGEVVGNAYWGDLNLEYNAGGSGSSVKKFSFASRVNDEELFMFSVPEAYIKYEWSGSSLALGRKVLDWGYMDSLWGFGKINNRKNFDFFEPGQEGLTGILFQKEDEGVRFSLFGSFVYAPELNPGQEYNEDEGTITCKTAWCRPQSQSAPLPGGNEVPIHYNIDYPDVSDVVFRYSAGANISMDLGPAEMEVFGIRKPENQISVAAEYYYENESQSAFVDVTPQVYYHDILGGNIKIKAGDNVTLYGGGLSVTPNTYPDGIDPEIVYTGLKPKKKKEEYLGGGVFYTGSRIKGGAHYVARVSEYDLENDLMVEYPRWNQAVNVNINALLTRKISVAFDHKFDMLTDDRLTMVSASYLVSPNTLASAGVNVVGTSDEVESFWSDFSNNDSVYGSLKVKF